MRHKGEEGQMKLILMAVGMVMFFAVVGSTYRALDQSPEISNNCIPNAALEPVANVSARISSEEDAREILENVTGHNVSFIYNTLEACDVSTTGYVFNYTDGITYAVCGDGKIYRYKDVCGKTEKWSSFISILGSKKDTGLTDRQ